MDKKTFLDVYFKSNPWFQKIVDVGEWIVIVAVGLILPTPKLPLYPITAIPGFLLIVSALWIHHLAHKEHREAHHAKEKIKKIVTTGIYSNIRHPCYAAYLFAYLGIFFIIGSLSTLVPILVFSFIFYDAAVSEENYLKDRFGDKYNNYMEKVPWRFVPKIF